MCLKSWFLVVTSSQVEKWGTVLLISLIKKTKVVLRPLRFVVWKWPNEESSRSRVAVSLYKENNANISIGEGSFEFSNLLYSSTCKATGKCNENSRSGEFSESYESI